MRSNIFRKVEKLNTYDLAWNKKTPLRHLNILGDFIIKLMSSH